jgi:hypothetical protein
MKYDPFLHVFVPARRGPAVGIKIERREGSRSDHRLRPSRYGLNAKGAKTESALRTSIGEPMLHTLWIRSTIVTDKNAEHAQAHSRNVQSLAPCFGRLGRGERNGTISDDCSQCHKRCQVEAIAHGKTSRHEYHRDSRGVTDQCKAQNRHAVDRQPRPDPEAVKADTGEEDGERVGNERDGRRRLDADQPGAKIGVERRYALQQIRNAGCIIERSDPPPTEVQVPVILKRRKTSGIVSNPVVLMEVTESQRIAPAFEIDRANRNTKEPEHDNRP